MASNISSPMSEKEIRYFYNGFSKEKLMDSVISLHMEIRKLRESNYEN